MEFLLVAAEPAQQRRVQSTGRWTRTMR
eukprot:COSAG04_NODE_7427_length_1127_cov_6.013592_1_plen_27_part_10